MVKRLLAAVALVCALAGSVCAQNTSTFGNITAASANCGGANCVFYQLPVGLPTGLPAGLPTGTPWVTVTISGTWTGTIQIASISAPNANYTNLNTVPWLSLATETGNGTWSVATGGATYLLVYASSWTSGTAKVTMIGSQSMSPLTNPVFPGVMAAGGLAQASGGGNTSCWLTNGGVGACNGGADPVASYGAAGNDSTTTVSGSLAAGANSFTITSASGWKSGMGIDIVGAGPAGVLTATSVSGGTISGPVLSTVTLSFNGGTGATASCVLATANTLTGAKCNVTANGSGYSSAPTSATISSGTATGSGTATVTTTTGALLLSCPIIAVNGPTVKMYQTDGSTPCNAMTTTSGATIHHDDTYALMRAIGSGANVQLPPGTFNVSDSLEPLVISTPIAFKGAGAGQTIIQNLGLTNGVFADEFWITNTSNASGGTPSNVDLGPDIGNFSIVQASGFNPTAGYGMSLVGSTSGTQWVTGSHIHDINMSQLWGGLAVLDGAWIDWEQNLQISYMVGGYCIYYDAHTPSGDQHLDNDECYGANTGVYVDHADTTEFTGLKTNVSPVTFGPDADGGFTGNERFANPSIEGGPLVPYAFNFCNTNAAHPVRNIQILGGEYETVALFGCPNLAYNLNYSGLANGNGAGPTITNTLGTTPVSAIPGDLICAMAADTSIGNITISSGSISGTTATLNGSFLASYLITGQQFGIANCTGTACSGLGSGPFTTTGATYNSAITFTTSASGTITGGNTFLWCKNQATDATSSSPQTFSNSPTPGVDTANWNTGNTHLVDAQVLVWTSASAEPLRFSPIMAPMNQVTPSNSLSGQMGDISFNMNLLPGCNLGGTSSYCWLPTIRSVGIPGVSTIPMPQFNVWPNPGNYSQISSFNLAYFPSSGVASITSGTGGTITGTATQTCNLASFSNGYTATGVATLTATNSLSGATYTNTRGQGGSGTTSVTATLSSGTATCSGTATLTIVPGGGQGNAVMLVDTTDRP